MNRGRAAFFAVLTMVLLGTAATLLPGLGGGVQDCEPLARPHAGSSGSWDVRPAYAVGRWIQYGDRRIDAGGHVLAFAVTEAGLVVARAPEGAGPQASTSELVLVDGDARKPLLDGEVLNWVPSLEVSGTLLGLTEDEGVVIRDLAAGGRVVQRIHRTSPLEQYGPELVGLAAGEVYWREGRGEEGTEVLDVRTCRRRHLDERLESGDAVAQGHLALGASFGDSAGLRLRRQDAAEGGHPLPRAFQPLFSPDGRHLAVRVGIADSRATTGKIIEADSGRDVTPRVGHPFLWFVQWLDEDRVVALGGRVRGTRVVDFRGELLVCRISTGACTAERPVHLPGAGFAVPTGAVTSLYE